MSMNKIIISLALTLFSGIISTADYGCAYSQSQRKIEKIRSKQYKSKIKELKSAGWELNSSSRTLEIALLDHYEKLKDPNNQEIIGTASGKSTNVLRQVAFNNAITYYAGQAASVVKGRIVSDQFSDGSDESAITEFDKFYAAYERLVNAEIKSGVLMESFSIRRKSGNIYEYQTFFIVNEDKALEARKRAMQRAVEETKLAQKYAAKVSEFVNEGFNVETATEE